VWLAFFIGRGSCAKLLLMMMLKLMLGYLAKLWVKQERVVRRLRSIRWLAVLVCFVLFVALSVIRFLFVLISFVLAFGKLIIKKKKRFW